jgi:hypothetical protein
MLFRRKSEKAAWSVTPRGVTNAQPDAVLASSSNCRTRQHAGRSITLPFEKSRVCSFDDCRIRQWYVDHTQVV